MEAAPKTDTAIFMSTLSLVDRLQSPNSKKDRQGFYFRCRICHCPILQNGDFCLCLGCVNDRSMEISESLMRRKASVTSFEGSYILSEVLFQPRGNTPSKPKVCAPGSILSGRSVNKSLQLLILGLFLPVSGLLAQTHNYDSEAKRLAKISCRRARVEVISKTLREIDRNLAKHFPHGPFRREDLIAICLGESSFWHEETGSFGERGLFQLMGYWFPRGVDGYQVSANVDMACRVLKLKHSRWHDRKRTIIAYNGLIRRNGKIDERYWRWFCHNRAKVCKALRIPPHQNFASKPKPPKIRINPELARQFEAAKQLRIDIWGQS